MVFSTSSIVASIKGLQSIYGNKASFKSPAQARAVTATIHGEKSLIVNLPTGDGKSMVIFAPIHSAPNGVVVVVVPLAALQTDYYNKAQKYGITYKVWTRSLNYMDAPSLVIVSVDGADTTEFVLFVKQLSKMVYVIN